MLTTKHLFLRNTLLLIALLALGACSTTEHRAGSKKWIELFTPSNEMPASQADLTYSIDQVEKDTKTLEALQNELAQLTNEIAGLKRHLHTNEAPYLNDTEDKQIELFIYRAIQAHALHQGARAITKQNHV